MDWLQVWFYMLGLVFAVCWLLQQISANLSVYAIDQAQASIKQIWQVITVIMNVITVIMNDIAADIIGFFLILFPERETFVHGCVIDLTLYYVLSRSFLLFFSACSPLTQAEGYYSAPNNVVVDVKEARVWASHFPASFLSVTQVRRSCCRYLARWCIDLGRSWEVESQVSFRRMGALLLLPLRTLMCSHWRNTPTVWVWMDGISACALIAFSWLLFVCAKLWFYGWLLGGKHRTRSTIHCLLLNCWCCQERHWIWWRSSPLRGWRGMSSFAVVDCHSFSRVCVYACMYTIGMVLWWRWLPRLSLSVRFLVLNTQFTFWLILHCLCPLLSQTKSCHLYSNYIRFSCGLQRLYRYCGIKEHECNSLISWFRERRSNS